MRRPVPWLQPRLPRTRPSAKCRMGVIAADYDNDGDQDLYVTMGGAYDGDVARNVLFRNPGHGNRWITLRLEGVRSNRSAIGARVPVARLRPRRRRTASPSSRYSRSSFLWFMPMPSRASRMPSRR